LNSFPAVRHAGLLAVFAVAALLLGAGEPATSSKPNPGKSGRAAETRPPKNAPAEAATAQRQQALHRQQLDLQRDLMKLKRELSAREASRSDARDALADSETAISDVNRRLRELASARTRLEQQIAALGARERAVTERQGEQMRQSDLYLRQRQMLELRSPAQLLLEGDNPGRLGREGVYLAYLSRDSEASVNQLEARRQELAALHAETTEKSAELSKLAEDELRNRQELEREQARRKRALQQLSKDIAAQQQSISRLERDEQRLGALLDQISRLLSEQSRKEAERARRHAERDAANRQAANKPGAVRQAQPDTSSQSISPNEPLTGGNFAQLKGKLTLPVQGTVSSRFGAPRRADGASTGPTWKGVFVQAPAGSDVRSVGSGQVVFADWLRGFGNLLVIDHGDGFLSVYGNNESLLRKVGDRVAVGDVVALVGNTGGNETPGLYFELRFQGRPFDPLGWVAAR
jgi:septal ring factor EnvC (AmiA/AmiB activator)